MCLSCNWILQEVTKIHEVLWMLCVLHSLPITWGFPFHIRLRGKKPFIRYTNKYIMYMTECIGERKVYYIWSFISLCVCVFFSVSFTDQSETCPLACFRPVPTRGRHSERSGGLPHAHHLFSVFVKRSFSVLTVARTRAHSGEVSSQILYLCSRASDLFPLFQLLYEWLVS